MLEVFIGVVFGVSVARSIAQMEGEKSEVSAVILFGLLTVVGIITALVVYLGYPFFVLGVALGISLYLNIVEK